MDSSRRFDRDCGSISESLEIRLSCGKPKCPRTRRLCHLPVAARPAPTRRNEPTFPTLIDAGGRGYGWVRRMDIRSRLDAFHDDRIGWTDAVQSNFDKKTESRSPSIREGGF